jgi:hypothetical protein
MNPQTDINLNHADCLRSVTDFGKTTVHNICNGSVNEVPWGSADWALALGLTAFGAIFIFAFILAGIVIIREAFFGY